MRKKLFHSAPLFLIVASIAIFFAPFFFNNKLPLPADTIVGLYHPYRDAYAQNYPNGIPFKNFLITDPVRQTYVWKNIAIESYEKAVLPVWNPYEMTGKPLLANFQTGVFYPINLILFLNPFYFSWSVFIFLQVVLGAYFMNLYLKNLQLDNRAAAFGTLAFLFSGFSVAWLEWGNVVHTVIWLPFMLLCVDKITLTLNEKFSLHKRSPNKSQFLMWYGFFHLAFAAAFFAGHLQTFFYITLLVGAYTIGKWISFGNKTRTFFAFFLSPFLFTLLTFIQWYPTLQFIKLSARAVDQGDWQKEGWFIPLQHLVQFIAPDFFGNPTTLNYWGTWNYAEMVGYIGVFPLFFGLASIFFIKKKLFFFWVSIAILSLLFAVENPISRLPFQFSVPFISTAQPTRLLVITIFALSVLSALGFDKLCKVATQRFNAISLTLFILLPALISIVLWFGIFSGLVPEENVQVVQRNLILPTVLVLGLVIGLVLFSLVRVKLLRNCILSLILLLTAFDLLRFANKFEPFTNKEYLFPETEAISYLKKDASIFRIASADSRILPPNFSSVYKIQSIEGYDPLYLGYYAELIAASERGEPNIKPPFGFNRIITPHRVDSDIIDLLNVKYVLSLDEITVEGFEEVFEEGATRVYRNSEVFPRAFFVKDVIQVANDSDSISEVFAQDLRSTAVVFDVKQDRKNLSVGTVSIQEYAENKVVMEVENNGSGFLVFTDAFYPTWKATIDGTIQKVHRTNHAFRGIFVPEGKHTVVFYITLF